MSKLKFETSVEGVYTKYLQNDSIVIVRVSHINQTSLPQAQTGLLLDFNIRDSVEEEKSWSAFQHTLRQIFGSVVAIAMIPNCQLKVNIFVLMAGFDIESAIINAVGAALLKMSIPMKYSIYAVTQSQKEKVSKKGNTLVVNLNGNNEIIYGKCRGSLSGDRIKQLQQFKNSLILSLNLSVRA